MNPDTPHHNAELALSRRYLNDNPWVLQAVTGFLSAYFMEHPGFRVQRHFDEPASGMHVWSCEVPAGLKVPRLLKRLQADIPPCRILQPDDPASSSPRYVIDAPGD
ncbi:hypothetical protein ACO9S2_14660 [Nitrospira sp. NS4]|uniref:hypothetical protein n=1 Tax=Nitrospira sp. NS4 TaxID=3414498 RepID=UPI003C2C0F5B